jgi:hypothetical protein
MIRDFERIPIAISDAALRGQVSNYFERVLVKPRNRQPNQKERDTAAARTLTQFPQLLDYYIKLKEETGDEASEISSERVQETKIIFETQVRELQELLAASTQFYHVAGTTYEEAHARLAYLKDVIENKGGHRLSITTASRYRGRATFKSYAGLYGSDRHQMLERRQMTAAGLPITKSRAEQRTKR